MKKLLVVAAACVLALTMAIPAAGADIDVLVDGGKGEVQLEGTVGTNVTQKISVTMPYKVVFAVKTDANEQFETLIPGTATVTNQSTCAVELQLTKVSQSDQKLLDKMKLSLVVGGQSTLLTPGTGLTTELAQLAKGTSAQMTISGEAAQGNPAIPTATYTVNTTITVIAVP